MLSKLENYYVIHDLQFGFTVGENENTVFVLIDQWLCTFFSLLNIVGWVYLYLSFDISKAYDKVNLNHQLLQLKLIQANVSDDIVLVSACKRG